MLSARANFYHSLAEAFSGPPDWMSRPGFEWPLYQAVLVLAPQSAAAHQAVAKIGNIPARSPETGKKHYQSLFNKPPCVWLYGSMYMNGKLAGPEMFRLARLYQDFGLEITLEELPDHAGVVLAFLAFLAEQQQVDPVNEKSWKRAERIFVREGAGKWLIRLGKAVFESGSEVYTPVGELLAAWLGEIFHPCKTLGAQKIPLMDAHESCSLCGFCAQVCPTSAMQVMDFRFETALFLDLRQCTGCEKCVRICEEKALGMKARELMGSEDVQILFRSPRTICARCQVSMVSQAELNYVSGILGNPDWLDYCPACRGGEVRR